MIKQQQKPKEPVVIIKEFPLAVTLVSIQQAHFFYREKRKWTGFLGEQSYMFKDIHHRFILK